jgi:hypothetical protein
MLKGLSAILVYFVSVLHTEPDKTEWKRDIVDALGWGDKYQI